MTAQVTCAKKVFKTGPRTLRLAWPNLFSHANLKQPASPGDLEKGRGELLCSSPPSLSSLFFFALSSAGQGFHGVRTAPRRPAHQKKSHNKFRVLPQGPVGSWPDTTGVFRSDFFFWKPACADWLGRRTVPVFGYQQPARPRLASPGPKTALRGYVLLDIRRSTFSNSTSGLVAISPLRDSGMRGDGPKVVMRNPEAKANLGC